MALDFPTERFARNGDGSQKPVAVLGGGPAGLTAGYLLAQKGRPVIVLEAEDQVGGIAKTEVRDGYRFDLGGHRFFTKSKEVDDLWHEVMKEEFLKRPRMSRIYWNGKFLDYPLNGTDVIKKLGPIELIRSGLSYLWARRQAQGQGGEPRAVGLQPLRLAPVQPLLQGLHGEGLGRPDHRAARRVGRPADQGPVLLVRRQGRLHGQRRQQDQVADQRVPLPPLRPRPDVGDDVRRDHRPRRRGPAQRPRRRHRGRGRPRSSPSPPAASASSAATSSPRCRCAPRSAWPASPPAPRRRSRTPRWACATATSSRSR